MTKAVRSHGTGHQTEIGVHEEGRRETEAGKTAHKCLSNLGIQGSRAAGAEAWSHDLAHF